MAKHNVKQTKGTFKLIGNVKGASSSRFFKTTTFDSGAVKQEVNFGVVTSKDNEQYVTVQGFEGKEAKFSKWDKDTKTNSTETVAWDDRFDFEKDGYNPMFGIRVGLTHDEKGKAEISNLFTYDAVDELNTSLEDGMGLYIEGNIRYSSYTKDGEKKTYKNFEPTKIYAQKEPVDFDNKDFKETNKFEQEIVYMDIEKEIGTDGKPTGRGILLAKIVTYDSVEDVDFIIEDTKLIGLLKKNLKPYYSIKIMGRLINSIVEEEVEDAWGDDEDMHTSGQSKNREMIITKAYPSSIDKETYSAEIIDSIVAAEESFGDSTEGFEAVGDDEDIWGSLDS